MKTSVSVNTGLGSGLLGIGFLLPASYFMLTMTARVFGAKSPYYFISPSFLQSPFHLLAFHKAQIILISLLAAILVLTCVSHRNFDFKDFAYTFSLVHSKGWGASLYTSI